jgi:uncharacterized membrane protein YqiK
MEKEGLGTQAKLTGEAQGRKAAASALQSEMEAKAAGDRAELVAHADGTRAQLVAEAEGVLKKAEAYKQLDQSGRFLLILQSLPPVVDAAGNAVEKVATPVARAIGDGLGNIKEVRLIDLGGGNSAHRNVLSQFANMPVETIYGVWQKLQALGFAPMVEAAAKQLGFDIDDVLKGVPPGLKSQPSAGMDKPAETPPPGEPSAKS